MKTVIDLLQQKNRYLLQFEKRSSSECDRLRAGDCSHIKQFYYKRQVILDAIENIDTHLNQFKPKKISKKDKKTITQLLQKNREITRTILRKDILIHSYLNGLQCDDIVEDQIA